MTQLYVRVHDALESIIDKKGVGAIVAHAGVARAIAAIGSRIAPEQLYALGKAENAKPFPVELSYATMLERSPEHISLDINQR